MNGPESLETEWVQQHLAEASTWLGNVWRQQQEAFFAAFPDRVESPLELVFMVWWSAYGLVHESYVRGATFAEVQHEVLDGGAVKYRLDVAVSPSPELQEAARKWGVAFRPIAVELDGHDFHERTREQVAERNGRDRYLSARGWDVLHFSGSEVHRNPVECVHQVYVRAKAMVHALTQAVIDKGGYEDVWSI